MIQVGPDFRPPPSLEPIHLLFLLLVVIAIEMHAAANPGTTYTLTSWYRDPMRNAAVGGVSTSRHLVGLGMDIVIDTPFSVGSIFGGIIAEISGSSPLSRTLSAIWRSLASPITQAVIEGDHTHVELDF